MSATIPISVPVFTTLQDDIDYVLAADQNTPNDEITALATMVGMLGKAQSWGVDFASYMKNQKVPLCTKASASTISVSAGAIWIANSGQTFRMPRRNTSAVTVTASNIDIGAMAVGFYYLYAVADSAANTFTVKFSLSATAPNGLTNFELIGWFYNQTVSVLDVTSGYVGNTKRFGVENTLTIVNNTDTSATGDTNYHDGSPTIKFYAPSRVISIKSMIQLYQGSINEYGAFCWSVDGVDQTTYQAQIEDGSGLGSALPFALPVNWKGSIAADTCTLIPRVKAGNAAYTTHMFNKIITIKEETI